MNKTFDCINCGKILNSWGAKRCRPCESKRRKGLKRPPFSKEWREKLSLAKTTNSVNYQTIHSLLVRLKGKAFGCERCKTQIQRRYEWSSNVIPLTRNPNDYESLCVPCHRKKDGHNMIYLFSSRYRKGLTNV